MSSGKGCCGSGLDRNDVGNKGFDISFFGEAFPVAEGMGGNIVLRVPILNGKTARFLFVKLEAYLIRLGEGLV